MKIIEIDTSIIYSIPFHSPHAIKYSPKKSARSESSCLFDVTIFHVDGFNWTNKAQLSWAL